MQASTAERTEVFTKLLKLIELAAQSQTVPVADATHAPIASPSVVTQTSSSAPVSPVPEPAPERRSEPTLDIAPPPSAPELPSLPQTVSQSDLTPDPMPDPTPDLTPESISAIVRCTAARNQAHAEAFAHSQPRYTADQAGAKAFRDAMPPLLGADNIREFIACVAHGMLIGVIENKDATKFLYAAQVAFSAQNRTEPKRTPKSAVKATQNNEQSGRCLTF